jgi:hypothetical protein
VSSRVLRIAAFAAALTSLVAGCGDDESKPESDLGGLLHSAAEEDKPIDVDMAQSKVEELERAVAKPYSRAAELLGAHRARTVATTRVEQGGKAIDELTTTTTIAFASPQKFSISAHNDKTYGRDVIYDGTNLYLRPRFGKYHARPPESSAEPAAMLDKLGNTLAAHLELLSPGAVIRTTKDELVAGRAAVKIELEKADSPRKRKPEALAQRKWREGATTESVSGSIALDKETGAVLAAKLKGKVSFTRDGDNYVMVLELDHQLEGVGSAVTVEVPPEDQRLSAPKTSKELDERETLLEGIAPPARRGKTPDNPRGEARPTDGPR